MLNPKNQNAIRGFLNGTVMDFLKNPQKMKDILKGGKGAIDKITDLADVSKWIQKIKCEQEKKR